MHTGQAPSSPYRRGGRAIRLNWPTWETVLAAHGLATDRQVADRLGISRSTWNRLRRGDKLPSPVLIASALDAFPDQRFEDMFVVGEDGEQ